ncbi:MAG: hypothetical protein ACLUL2_04780 [Blautia sp.]
MKTAMTEAGYISESYMEQLALSHPDISFKYMVNGQTKLHSSGNYQSKGCDLRHLRQGYHRDWSPREV